MSKKDYMWVDPMYKKKIKLEALNNDMTILEYTRRLAEEGEEDFKKNKKFKFTL